MGRILIVDDSRMARKVMLHVLEANGHKVAGVNGTVVVHAICYIICGICESAVRLRGYGTVLARSAAEGLNTERRHVMAKVMIVDDSMYQRIVLRTHIETGGQDVVAEAETGEEALELYDAVQPDLVTLNITMPGMDGLECLERLKTNHPSAKIIMVSAVGVKKKMRKALELGCVDYITKPYNDAMLREAIDRHTST